ncbi:hypothetical protein THAOC_16176 [Thalassiosira oceanica]|uniref:Methyltransferase domain-containing protein n=1 Tax=Thalassiosira oceanica TaxID=159749 RepID=K0SCX9_THAOC|nr:hypothetical protein THAOC_16176 [Thalassiosira oceanica]|eukprot:EJK63185.1 hypothetical protein THAOC_16176 [Thalassiosira oceanica]
MLPDRVVSALKEKYETDDAAAALSKALNEEGEGEDGEGALADLFKTVEEEVEDDGEEEKKMDDIAEEAEPEGAEPEEAEPVDAKPEEAEPEEAKPEEAEPEEAKPEEVRAAPQAPPEPVEEADEPVEEVREKLQELSIDEVEENDKAEQEEVPLTIDDGADPVEQTRRFYDNFSAAFVANVSDDDGALSPSSHRQAFVTHIQLRQDLNTDDPVSLLDVGCGHGRDARRFAAEGHSVLGVDCSGAMLGRAAAGDARAPNLHLLKMDVRSLGGGPRPGWPGRDMGALEPSPPAQVGRRGSPAGSAVGGQARRCHVPEPQGRRGRASRGGRGGLPRRREVRRVDDRRGRGGELRGRAQAVLVLHRGGGQGDAGTDRVGRDRDGRGRSEGEERVRQPPLPVRLCHEE